MKKIFKSRLEAIGWIAGIAANEGLFEVRWEQLNVNFIYSGTYYLDLEEEMAEVVLLQGVCKPQI